MIRGTVSSFILVVGVVAGLSIVAAGSNAYAQSEFEIGAGNIERSSEGLPPLPDISKITAGQTAPLANPLDEARLADRDTLGSQSELAAEVARELEQSMQPAKLSTSTSTSSSSGPSSSDERQASLMLRFR